MPRAAESKVIDGDLYEMTLFGATQGYRLFHRLFQMFGPSLGQLVDATAGGKNIQDVDLASDAVVRMLKDLVTRVGQDDLDAVIAALKNQTHVGIGGSDQTVPLSGVFELHFSGRIGTMFSWLAWGLKVQYQSFFDAFVSSKPPEKGAASSAATDPKP